MKSARAGAAVTAALLVMTIGCGDRKGNESAAASKANLPEGSFAGPVLEVIHTGGYTYLRVAAGEDTIWAAAPEFAIDEGTEVVVPPGMPMPDHHSGTLDRTFDLVYFVSEVVTGGGGASLPDGHPERVGGGMPGGPAETPPTVDMTGIEKPAGGMTVAEIYGKAGDLAGEEVRVRGKVVKFTSNIMGTNWIHLRDGTGAEGANDLTVTTMAKARVGDTVLVRGTLSVDRDFGYGYFYEVIVENGEVTVE